MAQLLQGLKNNPTSSHYCKQPKYRTFLEQLWRPVQGQNSCVGFSKYYVNDTALLILTQSCALRIIPG